MSETMTHKERFERRRQIAEYARDHGKSKAASHFKVSLGTVVAACREHEIKPQEKGKASRTNTFMVLKRLMDGASLTEIGQEMGVSRQYVLIVKRRAESVGIIFKAGAET